MFIPVYREQLRELEASTAIVGKKIEMAEADIQARLSTLKALKKEQSELAEKESALKSLLAPIRSIPNELLAVVFRNTIERPAVMGKEDRQTLTFVRRVCERWDAVATSTPDLWRNLDVNWRENSYRAAGFIARLETWFSHEGAGASLRLSLGATNDHHVRQSSRRFAEFLTSDWNWHEVHLSLDTITLFRILENIAIHDKPWRSLKRLALAIAQTAIGTYHSSLERENAIQ
ncbi:hypothetical protein BKA70DRAFT_1285920 [Coprinopsis sp. MPI-PUGE-AT-0042]|nr:hypothetical protein BKA70DRAFT_1285920 [Coprinopsis sp. MPI-PUGE-AT-0042]